LCYYHFCKAAVKNETTCRLCKHRRTVNKIVAICSRSGWKGNTCRVTRLNEFSPNGRFFTLGSFLLITGVYLYYVLILTRNALGNILGDFFSNTPFHPEHRVHLESAWLSSERISPE
jgi:hypothetical protein